MHEKHMHPSVKICGSSTSCPYCNQTWDTNDPHPPECTAEARLLTNPVGGYESLERVLVRAYEQAAIGKGSVRHAQNTPFNEQPMQKIIDLHGVGFATGQATKKLQESRRLSRDAAIAEMLGAIVYISGAIIAIERGVPHD